MSVLGRQLGGLTGGIHVEGLHWRFSEAGRQLLQPSDLMLSEHLRSGAATVVKHGLHRTVYRAQLDGFAVYWKHCRIKGLAAYIRQWIRPAKAYLEFSRAQALAARGIKTVEPLAWAKHPWRKSGPSHLITRELAGTQPLGEFLLAQASGRARRELTVKLGKYLAKLHEAGVIHPDLHPGNILVRITDGAPEFILLDTHNIALRRPLSLNASRANLVVFNRWFHFRAERTDRLRFWEAYCLARGWRNALHAGRVIEERMHESNRALWRDRSDRYWRNNKNFRVVAGPAVRGHAVRELSPEEIDQFLADPDQAFRPDARYLKNSATSTIVEVSTETAGGPVKMVYKRFRLKKRGAAPANLFRLSTALRSWKMGHALIDRGLNSPRPFLVIHRRDGLLPREGYLLCEKVENGRELSEAVAGLERKAKWDLIHRLARTLYQMHDSGVSHRDLKAANLLVTFNPDERAVFHFIDLVGVRLLATVSDSVRIRNLSRLLVSFVRHPSVTRTDFLRFLRSYHRWALKGRGDWKTWWKELAAASRAKLLKNQRSGRVVT